MHPEVQEAVVQATAGSKRRDVGGSCRYLSSMGNKKLFTYWIDSNTAFEPYVWIPKPESCNCGLEGVLERRPSVSRRPQFTSTMPNSLSL